MHLKQIILAALLVVSSAVVFAIHTLWPSPRFEYAPLNYIIFVLAHAAVPIVLTVFALSKFSYKRNTRIALGILAAISAAPVTFVCYVAISQLAVLLHSGEDPSLLVVSELDRGKATYRLYRTGLNPYKAHGLILRRESHCFFGMKCVEEIKGFYGTSDGLIEAYGPSTARIITKPYSRDFKTEVFEFSP